MGLPAAVRPAARLLDGVARDSSYWRDRHAMGRYSGGSDGRAETESSRHRRKQSDATPDRQHRGAAEVTPEATRYSRIMRGILEQIEKRQFWNAIIRTHELTAELHHSFDAILKQPWQEPPPK